MTVPLVPVAVIASQWFVRRYYANGPGLGRAIGTGLLTALIASAVSAATLYGFARAASPILLERNAVEARQILQGARSYYLKQPGGAKQYELEQQALGGPTKPEGLAQDEFVKKMLLGFLFAIPGGIFLRK
ncbi:hypothetical protein GCM10011383_40920 [Hymenobacter cavernae]|uniref:DUF4199 domain-containing protein n=2 Tax=Hymenobacter cavernae TaxID=2044852 RepID=A0ABQ1URM7_9BACT|nr:hypothetical protein GCM10011383_40920 [Hymenobacter cavernae]